MITKNITALLLILLAGGTWAGAQNQQVVTTSVPFLRVSPDVRSSGIGDAGIATTADAYSVYRNLAKIPFAAKPAVVAASYTPWLQKVSNGVYLAAATGYYQLDNESAVGGSIRYFNIGTAQYANENGDLLGTHKPYDMAIDAGYARKLSDKFGIGVALRYIRSSIASGAINGDTYKAGSAFSADVSLYYNGINAQGSGFLGGLTLTNLGTKISYTQQANAGGLLPANLGIGGGYQITDDAYTVAFTAEVNKLLVPVADDETDKTGYVKESVMQSWTKSFNAAGWKTLQYSAGVEWGWNQTVFLRGGILADGSRRMAGDDGMHLTFGAGLHYQAMQLDVSFLSAKGYGGNALPAANTLRLGLAYSFAASK
ncbi:hypothetical protein SAMN05421788_109195 [Filimonas lacunae]|uniref:Type IX secretion system protein PorV domain-containing protein n=1 Tax=Filimonas lacunae TaxID=477680 RepID=A0A1N7R5C6_9BACT|nr:type IX secretion system outer membrane channel protein PorV [Filimonas lacunae]SIT30326.1 hypothetical protein SAMN05421788_109195 [Filimonas lacunae]